MVKLLNLPAKRQGFVAFTSLLVVSTVALAIAISVSLLGIGEAKSSLDFKKGKETLALAQGCTQEALLRLKESAAYNGSSLNLGDGSCTINVSGSGSQRTVKVVAEIDDPPSYVKKIRLSVKRTGFSTNLLNWEEY